MTTDQTRNDVWHGLLDAVRLVRYYEALSNRNLRWRQLTRLLLLAVATSAIAALLGLLPEMAQRLVYGFVAILAAWDLTFDFAKKAAVLHQISVGCTALENEWGQLWSDVDRDDAEDAEIRRRIQQLLQRGLEVTKEAGKADIRIDPKLNESCAESAYEVIRARYAV